MTEAELKAMLDASASEMLADRDALALEVGARQLAAYKLGLRDGSTAQREAAARECEHLDSEAEPFVKGGVLLEAARHIRALKTLQ